MNLWFILLTGWFFEHGKIPVGNHHHKKGKWYIKTKYITNLMDHIFKTVHLVLVIPSDRELLDIKKHYSQ